MSSINREAEAIAAQDRQGYAAAGARGRQHARRPATASPAIPA